MDDLTLKTKISPGFKCTFCEQYHATETSALICVRDCIRIHAYSQVFDDGDESPWRPPNLGGFSSWKRADQIEFLRRISCAECVLENMLKPGS